MTFFNIYVWPASPSRLKVPYLLKKNKKHQCEKKLMQSSLCPRATQKRSVSICEHQRSQEIFSPIAINRHRDIRTTTVSTCIEPSAMPPAMHFPSRSQVHVVTGTLPGLASFGFMTYPLNDWSIEFTRYIVGLKEAFHLKVINLANVQHVIIIKGQIFFFLQVMHFIKKAEGCNPSI